MLLADACRAGLCGVPAAMREVYKVSSIKKMGLSDSICSNGLAHPAASTQRLSRPPDQENPISLTTRHHRARCRESSTLETHVGSRRSHRLPFQQPARMECVPNEEVDGEARCWKPRQRSRPDCLIAHSIYARQTSNAILRFGLQSLPL